MFDMSSAIISATSIGLTFRHSGLIASKILFVKNKTWTGIQKDHSKMRLYPYYERALNQHYIIVLYPFPVFCQIIYWCLIKWTQNGKLPSNLNVGISIKLFISCHYTEQRQSKQSGWGFTSLVLRNKAFCMDEEDNYEKWERWLNVQGFSDICHVATIMIVIWNLIIRSAFYTRKKLCMDGFFPHNKRMINCQNPIISMINVRESWKRKKRRKKKDSASRLRRI